MNTALTKPLTDPITDLDAHALSHAIHSRSLSCREVMQAYLRRIHALNPQVNAIVAMASDEALLKQADAADAELDAGRSRGFLHGMPQAIKDAAPTQGFVTSFGSPLLANTVTAADGVMASRMRGAGAIIVGRSNMPEWGLGSHTYNPVYGPTCNPWDLSRSAGGSSGGAAVALSLRMLPLADGSDFMGSLRNPAGWNHVFGLRPSQGRVPAWPRGDVWVNQLGTEGPMARNVRDLSALLDIQAGYSEHAPLSLEQAARSFVPAAGATVAGTRVAWLGNLNGHLAMEDGVLECCEAALQRMAAAGAQVQPSALGFEPERLWQAWLVWRRALVAPNVGSVMGLPGARERIKPEALWEYDQAQGLSFNEFMAASGVRTAFYQHLLGLFERHDVLALPTAQCWPFAMETTWPRELGGRAMDTYHRWMEVTLYATFAGLPAISVPAGFDASGRWPMGLQLIGRPRGDAELLRLAAGYEALVGDLLARRPPLG